VIREDLIAGIVGVLKFEGRPVEVTACEELLARVLISRLAVLVKDEQPVGALEKAASISCFLFPT
jgi:hypothetical protein